MAEFVNNNSIVFKNKTDASFDVAAGIVFRKSGLYRVTVDEKTIIVETVMELGEKKKNDAET